MSKELQSLIIKIDKSHWEIEKEKKQINRCIDVIKERELKAQKYDDLNNANLNEALECVEALKEDGCITTLYQGKALETIRQALLQAEQYKKVLNSLIGKVIWVDNGILECGNTEQDCVLGFDVFPDEEEYTFICNFIEKMTEKKDRSE